MKIINFEYRHIFNITLIFLMFLTIAPLKSIENIEQAYPVVIKADTLFYFYNNFASFSSQERALITQKKLNDIIKNKSTIDTIYIRTSESFSEIIVNNESLLTITDMDAVYTGISRDSLAIIYINKLKESIPELHTKISTLFLVRNIVFSLLILICAFSINYVILKFSYKFELLLIRLNEKNDTFIKIFPKFNFNLKNILSVFIYFYNGLKLILIIFVVIKSISFLLDLVKLNHYWNYQPFFTGVFNSLTLTILSYYIYKLAKVFVLKVFHKFNSMKPHILEKMQYKSFSLISEDKLLEIAKYCTKLLYASSLIILSYFYITLLFSFFSFTETWAEKLFSYILSPVQSSLLALINYLPNVFAILVVFFMIKYTLKIIKYIFDAVENETITIPNFYKDWSEPTYKIVRFLVIVFGMIVTFPYLPGASSPFFRGISVFIGVLFSLGSSSAISNIVAGVVLTYMRPFKVGDRVKIAETMGDVIEKTLLVSRIRTIKNVDITIPNAMVLSSHIINYSSSSQDTGLIVHTSITIGYDVPWKTVHELLIKAALSSNLILNDPKPFVLQTALDDFYVNYELNAYTKYPSRMALIYSDIHQNIQNKFNEAGVEIMSPHYSAIRDGNQITVPEKHLSENYEKPSFKVDTITKIFTDKK